MSSVRSSFRGCKGDELGALCYLVSDTLGTTFASALVKRSASSLAFCWA